MNYATILDIQERYPQRELINIASEDGLELNLSAIERALTDADAEVDAYVGRRYVLPLASVDDILVRITCDIAVYRLQTLRPLDDVKDARQRYDDAIKVLKAIANGDMDLQGACARGDRAEHNNDSASAGMPQFLSTPNNFDRKNRL